MTRGLRVAWAVLALATSPVFAQFSAPARLDGMVQGAQGEWRLRASRRGFVEVNAAGPRGAQLALEAFARHLDHIMLACDAFWHSNRESPEVAEVPDTAEGMWSLAAGLGYRVTEVAPGVDLLAAENERCPEVPVALTVEPVTTMGIAREALVAPEQFERRLFQRGTIHVPPQGLHGPFWEGLHYWPTREGAGREFYVVGHVSSTLHPQHPPSRGLQKIAASFDTNEISLTSVWTCIIEGPVAQLELDFDEDGVIDVVAFSGTPGGKQYAESPLLVISGRSGEKLGTIGEAWDYEYVISELPNGVKRMTTLGLEGFGYYEVDREGRVVLDHRDVVPRPTPPPQKVRVPASGMELVHASLLNGAVSPTTGKPAFTLVAGERILAHFVTELIPAALDRLAFRGIPVLPAIGTQMLWPGKDAPELKNAHILLDYRPGEREKQPAAQP